MSYLKFYIYKKQYSTDSGQTWSDVSPLETSPSGNPIGNYSTLGECEQGQPPQYRTTSGTPYCQGYDKYIGIYSQVSYDGGITWSTTATTPTLIEANSQDCGYVPPAPASGSYLTFEAIDSGTFKFSGNSISYSLDSGNTWETLSSDTSSPIVSAGNKIMWKRIWSTSPSSYVGVGKFSSTGRFNVEGNAMSLVYGDNFNGQTSLSEKDRAFGFLFQACYGLISAEHLSLPATTLSHNCYNYMFQACTGLTVAPQLPATTLISGCYGYMFSGCTSLTTAPELPAPTLVAACYDRMFYACTSLSYIKCLATIKKGTDYWVKNVSSTGTFVKAASMNDWTTGDSGIPSGWTVQDAT